MGETPRDRETSVLRGHRAGRAGQAVRGLAALVVLLALCVGIPLALVALTPVSFPSGGLNVAQILAELTHRDDGTLFLAVLTIAGWLGWATFVVAVLVEIPARLRGVSPVRIRGLALQQTFAAALVTAAFTVFLVPATATASDRSSAGLAARPGRGAPTAAPGVTAAPTHVERHEPLLPGTPPEPGGRRPSKGSSPVLAAGEYLVREGDTLWDIAAEHLGDGSRWRLVADVNYGRPQPDGGRLDRSHLLRPGWRLIMPTEAAPRHDTRRPESDGHGVRKRTVRPGDTLSGIAEQELGDAARYGELASSSRHIEQPNGRHLTDPDVIYPGWTIEIPAGRDPSASLPGVADAHHRSPARHEQSTAPARPDAVRRSEARPTVAADPGVPLDPSWQETSTSTGRSGHSSVSAMPASAREEDARAGDSLVDEVMDVRTAEGVGGLLAASLLLLVGARRSHQQRRRRPGQRIRLPSSPALAAEARLRAVADPAGLEHVDHALRALAAGYRALGGPPPGLRVARLTSTHLELYLTEAARLPQPWVPTSDPTVWAMRHEDLTRQPETDMPAPFPGLVTVGHDLDGAYVLVDLEQLGALAVDGGRDDTLPVLAALAVELATSPWADDLLVTLVGCLPELPGAVPSGRLRHVGSVERLVTELEGRAQDVDRVLREAGVDGTAAARGAGVADDACSPEIVILADILPSPLRDRLEDVLYAVPRVGLAAVTAGDARLSDWHLVVHAGSDTARLEPTGLTLRPQRLRGAEYAHVLEMVRVTEGEAVPGPSWAARLPELEQDLADLPVPIQGSTSPSETGRDPSADDADESEDEGSVTTADERPLEGGTGTAADVAPPGRPPFVRLFGSVEVVGAQGPEPVSLKDGRAVASHLGRATALVAYLASRSQGATIEQVGEALSPARRLSPNTLWSLASRTRKWLGSGPDGVPYFPRASDARSNRLHPAIRTDWSLWQELVGHDVTNTPLPRLLEALALVRGRPFEAVVERHYTWAEPLRQEMIAGVVDVAHEVVRRALLVQDTASARRAATVARVIDPTNELVWRDALRVEYVAGNRESHRRLVEQLYAMADDLETDLEPETEQLISEIERSALRKAAPR
jgi:nucleoid-associated protein YgaU